MDAEREMLNAFEELDVQTEVVVMTDTHSHSVNTPETECRLDRGEVTRIIGDISSDPILALASDIEKDVKLLQSKVDEITEALQPLRKCVSFHVIPSTARDNSWKQFHATQGKLLEALNDIVHHRQLSSFVLLSAMDHLLKTSSHHQPSPSSLTPTSLTEDEKDIVIYVGGFVLFRALKDLRKDECHSLVSQLIKKDAEPKQSKLVQVKDRGGLCEPTSDMIVFFELCESVFQSMSKSHSLSLDYFVQLVCAHEDLLSSFARSIHEYDDVELDESSMEVLMYVLQVFFHLRCHARCRNIMENYLSKSKKSRKQKGIRKQID